VVSRPFSLPTGAPTAVDKIVRVDIVPLRRSVRMALMSTHMGMWFHTRVLFHLRHGNTGLPTWGILARGTQILPRRLLPLLLILPNHLQLPLAHEVPALILQRPLLRLAAFYLHSLEDVDS